MQAYNCVAFDEKAFATSLKTAASSGQLRLLHSDIQLDDCVCLDGGRKQFLILRRANRRFDVSAFRELAYYHFIRSKYQRGFGVDPHRKGTTLALNAKGIRNLFGFRGVFRCIWLIVTCCITATPWYLHRGAAKALTPGVRERIRRLLK